MILYRLIMWKRRWFGMAPVPRYVLEKFTDESVHANGGYFPHSWLLDCDNATVIHSHRSMMCETVTFLWVIR